MIEHLAVIAGEYVGVSVAAFWIFARSIAKYQSVELSQRYGTFAGSLGLFVAVIACLASLSDVNVLWALPATVGSFGASFYIAVDFRARHDEDRDRIRQYWRAHVDAGEDVGDFWSYGGKLYNFGEEEREAMRTRLTRQWPKYLQLLREALEPLAASPSEQRRYVEIHDSPERAADELTLEFNEILELLPRMVEACLLTRHQADLIQAVERKLEHMSQEHDSDLWHIDALDTSHEWADVRNLAKGALRALPEFSSDR